MRKVEELRVRTEMVSWAKGVEWKDDRDRRQREGREKRKREEKERREGRILNPGVRVWPANDLFFVLSLVPVHSPFPPLSPSPLLPLSLSPSIFNSLPILSPFFPLKLFRGRKSEGERKKGGKKQNDQWEYWRRGKEKSVQVDIWKSPLKAMRGGRRKREREKEEEREKERREREKERKKRRECLHFLGVKGSLWSEENSGWFK